jgi:hypothetical protein
MSCLSPEGEYLVRKAMQAMEAGRPVKPILAQARRELSGASLCAVEESIRRSQWILTRYPQPSPAPDNPPSQQQGIKP